MALAEFVCAFCGKPGTKSASEVNRAARAGLRLYCNHRCVGMSKRLNRTVEERKQLKREYDAVRREALRDEIAAKKREYHQRTYDPDIAREYRKTRRFDHTAYCRRYYSDPEKKAEKVAYDLRRREVEYGDFAECWRLLIELEREVRTRVPDKYERQKGRGYFTRINERKRHDRQDRREAERRQSEGRALDHAQ